MKYVLCFFLTLFSSMLWGQSPTAPDTAYCKKSDSNGPFKVCFLSNHNIEIQYDGHLRQLDSPINIVVIFEDKSLTLYRYSDNFITGPSPRNCEVILRSGRFGGWHCQYPKESETDFFSWLKQSHPLVIEFAAFNESGDWDSDYGRNYQFDLP